MCCCLCSRLSPDFSVALKGKELIDAESFASADDETRGAAAEEGKVIEEALRRLQEIPQQPVPERDDDWFVLLDALPKETSYVPPGIAKIPCTASQLYQSEQLSRALQSSYP